MDPIKVAFLTTAVGGTGLGTYGLYSYGVFSSSKKENLGTRLESEEFILLTDSHTQQWSDAVSKYNEKKSAGDQNIDVSQLKGICKNLVSKEGGSDSEYKKAKLYCVVPQSVSERLSKLKFKVLNTTDSTNQDKWTSLATSYVTKGKGDDQIENLNLQTSQENNWSTLRDNCGTILGKSHWEDNFESYFSKSKKWCTEEAFVSLSVQ